MSNCRFQNKHDRNLELYRFDCYKKYWDFSCNIILNLHENEPRMRTKTICSKHLQCH